MNIQIQFKMGKPHQCQALLKKLKIFENILEFCFKVSKILTKHFFSVVVKGILHADKDFRYF